MKTAQRDRGERLRLPSHVVAVTVHRQGATIRRHAPLMGDGATALRIDDLPLCLDDASVSARLEGAAEGCVRELRVILAVPENASPEKDLDEGALEKAQMELERTELRLARCRATLEALEGIELGPRLPAAEGEDPRPSPLSARMRLADDRRGRVEELLGRLGELEREKREGARLVESLRRRKAEASTARRARPDELRKAVELELAGSLPADGARVVLEYFVPGARWAPAYSLEFDESLSAARLRLRAAVRQRTGEDWTGVSLTLSTADATAWFACPELPSLRIGRRQDPPPVTGWRPPPGGLEELYGDYDRAFAGGPPSPSLPPPPPQVQPICVDPAPEMETEEECDDFAADEDCCLAPPCEGALMDMPCPAPQAPTSVCASVARSPMMTGGYGGAAAPPSPPGGAPPPPRPSRARMDGRKEKKKAMLEERLQAKRERRRDMAKEQAEDRDDAGELVAPEDLLAYGRLRMAAPDETGRGKLVLLRRERRYLELLTESRVEIDFDLGGQLDAARRAAEEIGRRAAPPRCAFPESWDGFDHAYGGTVAVDVPSDGKDHLVPVLSMEIPSTLRYVTVPREAREVFRMATLENGGDAPLLRGPVDVSVGRAFLLSADLGTVAPGGEVDLGLGVEEGIEVARNTRFSEETSGLLGGNLSLHHEIRVDVTNHLDRAVTLEIRERVPRADGADEHVEVELGDVEPPWESYDQRPRVVEGGHRWVLELEAGEKRSCTAAYEVKLPAKRELVGGNRREA